MKFILLFFLLSLSAFSGWCQQIKNKFSDPVYIRIADFQDRRLKDSLYHFFKSKNAGYRKDAVRAFASIQDTTSATLSRLANVLLYDVDGEVRQAATYALGQCNSRESFRILEKKLTESKIVSPEIIEAIGKTAKGKLILPKETVSGKAWAYYRFAFNNKTGDAELKECLAFFEHVNDTVNLKGALQFFSRTKALNNATPPVLILVETKLIEATKNKSAEVRMTAVSALRKILTDSSFAVIGRMATHDVDYRVRVNAVRSLQAFPFEKTQTILAEALHDQQVNVCIVASDVIKQNVTEAYVHEALEWARYNKHPLVQANLYEGVLTLKDKKEIADEIESLYRLQTNPYHKAALITTLQQSVRAYSFIASELFATETPVIRSSAAAALVAINQRKNFDKGLASVFGSLYKQAIVDGDPAVIGTVCNALSDSSLGYKKIFDNFSFLREAKNKLSLPKDFEALQPLEAAIAYFENKKPTELKNEFNHPIDWALVKTIFTNQEAVIKTSKGNIVIRLLVEEAPGSVANFVSLVNAKYYDHKVFHRVVPNFVVQAGCNRGDGWGSEDYSIRSEFSGRRFVTGSMGMASAGKDTEGTQWFITHSPTPHLDGRYSLFAQVIEGMNVVHLLEQGDEILEVIMK